MTNMERIEEYKIDIDFIGKVSAFEFDYAMFVRSKLENDYKKLTPKEKLLLLEQDKRLIADAQKYFTELKMLYGDRNEPIEHWWYHLDKIVSGELVVDLENQKICLKDNEHAATLTA